MAMIYEGSLRPLPLPQVMKDELANHGRYVRYPAKSRVFLSGDDPDGFVQILSGQVSFCRYLEDGSEIITNLAHPGQWIGGMSFLDQMERAHDAITLTKASAQVLSATRFRALLSEHRDVEQFFYREYSKWLRILLLEIENMIVYQAGPRLAKKLLHLTETAAFWRQASAGLGIAEHPIMVTQEQLGLMVGLSRKSVGQLVRQWTQAGWIDYKYGQLRGVNTQMLMSVMQTKNAPTSDI